MPFASKVRATWNGQQVGVMHACGHDAHTAILMGVADGAGRHARAASAARVQVHLPARRGEAARRRGRRRGDDDRGRRARRSRRRRRSSACTSPRASTSARSAIAPGRSMASSDRFSITVHGRQTHGADAVARRRPDRHVGAGHPGPADHGQPPLDITQRAGGRDDRHASTAACATTSFPTTWRCAAPSAPSTKRMRDDVHERVTTLAEAMARGARAGCTVCIEKNYPVTVNDPALTEAMLPTLRARGRRRQGAARRPRSPAPRTSRTSRSSCPGMFFFVGVTPPERRCGQGGAEPFAALPRRRAGAAARRALARAPGVRLSAGGLAAGGAEQRHKARAALVAPMRWSLSAPARAS